MRGTNRDLDSIQRAFSVLSIPLLAVGLAVSAAGCSGERGARELTVVTPLSGPDSLHGKAIANGSRLAAEELEAEHDEGLYPHELTLGILDSESEPDRAAELLDEAYDEGTVAAVGGVTDAEAVAMVPVAKKARRVLVSPSASTAKLSGATRYVFRISPSGATEGAKMASFASHELGLDRVALASTRAETESGALEAFRTGVEQNQGEVVAEVGFGAGAEDLESEAKRALENDPQAIYVVGAPAAVSRFVAVLESQGYRGAVMTTSSFAVREILDGDEGAEGVLLSRPLFDPEGEDPAVRAFADTYEERFGGSPDIHAAYAYDAVKVLAAALADRQVRPSELWSALRGIRDFKGLTGFIQFDERGDVASFPRVYVIRNGELVEYGELGEREQRRIARRVARLGASPSRLAG